MFLNRQGIPKKSFGLTKTLQRYLQDVSNLKPMRSVPLTHDMQKTSSVQSTPNVLQYLEEFGCVTVEFCLAFCVWAGTPHALAVPWVVAEVAHV